MFKFFAYFLQCRNPFRDKVCRVTRPEEALGPAEQPWVMLMPADAPAGPERFDNLVGAAEHRHQNLEGAGDENRAPFDREDQFLFRGERVTVAGGIVLDIFGGSLTGEPFTNIARVGAGALGQV